MHTWVYIGHVQRANQRPTKLGMVYALRHFGIATWGKTLQEREGTGKKCQRLWLAIKALYHIMDKQLTNHQYLKNYS